MLKIRTLTWNIGGGKTLAVGKDPSLMASYNNDEIEKIALFIKDSGADIVALQEVQRKEGYDQISIIADLAGYKYFFHDSTSKSHIDNDCILGHGIISKYPIKNHRFGLLSNPNIEVEWEDGSAAHTFDKGFSVCDVEFNGIEVSIATLHLLPFGRFAIDLDSQFARALFRDMATRLDLDNESAIIMGDFNINDRSIKSYLPDLFERYKLNELNNSLPTTPHGKICDHVLFAGLKLESFKIIDEFSTDHYPIVCNFTAKING